MTEVTSPRPRLLFLCQTLPFPPDGGVNIRTFNVLRLLARQFDVAMLCFYRASDRPTPRDVAAGIEGLRPLAQIEAFPIPQEHSRSRLLADHLRSVASARPYTHYAYDSSEFRAKLREWLKERDFPLVHMDSLDLVAYMPEVDSRRVICVHHNVESTLLRRRAHAERSGLRRRYLLHQASLVERTERFWGERVALNIAVSHNDMLELREIAPRGRHAVVPNGVDVDFFRPGPAQRNDSLIFVGGANWFPNRDALEFFSSDILPLIRRDGARPRVQWVGRASPALQSEYRNEHDIDLTGYVEDVRPLIADAACYVAPLRVGGGTRLKILDAWAMGKAVVSTSVGCEGLQAVDGRNILIRDEPAEFARAITSVLTDAALRRRLEEGARETAERLYSWEVIGADMNRMYTQVLHETEERPRPSGSL